MLNVAIFDLNIQLHNRYLLIKDDLIVADLHLGKTMHFRKAGLPVPPEARLADQTNLLAVLEAHQPKRCIVLGDLFHSEDNLETDEILMITSQFPQVDFVLVRGNHDILPESRYRTLDFDVVEELHISDLLLTHEPMVEVPTGKINMHGHIHPGIRLVGKAKQAARIPCFHISKQHFCIPAFGALTGLMRRQKKKGDRIFGIIESQVFEL